MASQKGAGADVAQGSVSTSAPEGRSEVVRALYLSMVREVFALSDEGRRADATSGDVDATTLPSSVLASSAVPSVAAGDWETSSGPPADGSAVRAIAHGAGTSGSPDLGAPAPSRCVDCGHGLLEGSRCGGRAAFPCTCQPFLATVRK